MKLATNYYDWILELLGPHLGSRILEVGAGIGTFSEYILRAAPAAQLVMLEPAINNIPYLRKEFADHPRTTVVNGTLGEAIESGSVDTVVTVNVLEHVPDDQGFAADAMRVLSPGGRLLIFVPGLPQIYGTLDEAFEHHRRYTRTSLRALLEGHGFEVELLRYSNFPGVAAWWFTGKVLRQRTIAPRQVWVYDRLVVPWLRRVERAWAPPLGQSLVAVARKPTTQSAV
jgi:FkbM family methyltransferase